MQYLGKTGTKGFSESLVIPLSDESSDLTIGDGVYTFYLPYDLTIDKMYLSLNTISSGADVVVDVQKNGSSIFNTSNSFKVVQGNNISTTQPDYNTNLYFTIGSKMSFNIDQIGSTTAGQGLKVMIHGHRTVDTEL